MSSNLDPRDGREAWTWTWILDPGRRMPLLGALKAWLGQTFDDKRPVVCVCVCVFALELWSRVGCFVFSKFRWRCVNLIFRGVVCLLVVVLRWGWPEGVFNWVWNLIKILWVGWVSFFVGKIVNFALVKVSVRLIRLDEVWINYKIIYIVS